jgi:hypothetical protein
MKTTTKSVSSLILVILFLFACILFLIIVFGAFWLHTFRVFTEQKPVAELAISELKEDELGTYFEVTYRQIKGRSPLTAVFNPSDENDNILQEAKTFKLYGDQVEVGGPTVKFRDILTLLNFKTVYKVGFIRAEYANIEQENARTDSMNRRFDLNGGYESWRDVQENIQRKTIQGRIMKMFIDSLPQIDAQGIFVTNYPQKITLCVTEEGFFICDKEIEE